MPFYFAKFCNETRLIWTGHCSLNDWAEQETSLNECVVQTARFYEPDDLFVGADFVLRAHGDIDDPDDPGVPVAVDPPLTLGWLLKVAAAVRYSEAPRRSRDYVLQRLRVVASRDEARALVANVEIALDWTSLEAEGG